MLAWAKRYRFWFLLPGIILFIWLYAATGDPWYFYPGMIFIFILWCIFFLWMGEGG
jgi:hypothetical protein